MNPKMNGNDQEKVIDNLSIGLTALFGISGAVIGTLIPATLPLVPAIQAAAYVPALIAVAVKRLIPDEKLYKKIEKQIKSCAEKTAKEYLAELKVNKPIMYSLFRDVWGNDSIYESDSTPDSIVQKMKGFLVTEIKWEGYEVTPKDINDVAQGYVDKFIINMGKYYELDRTNMIAIIKEQRNIRSEVDIIKDKLDRLNPGNARKIRAFYDYINGKFSEPPKSSLYGRMPLCDSYIEPSIYVDGTVKNVRDFFESWVGGESKITVISGEPGHGKTSLCWKAMCDFYNTDWLAGKVDNVFCFSLNPANTDALSNESFNLYSLLSWGDNRKNPEHVLYETDCTNALIFFDGFDELLEWHPGFNLIRFIEEKIMPFQEETGSHIVITTRNMAIEPYVDHYYLAEWVQVQIYRLQLITKKQQISWIESYIEQCCGTSPQKREKLEKYLDDYKELPKDTESEKILGIPILFRMIVEAQCLPKENSSIPGMYDELFHITWKRHLHREKGVDDELTTKKNLQCLALKIFIDDNDTAEAETVKRSPWLFSFYTSHKGKKRVGFLHRSFYQYFLAHEILTWYSDYSYKKNSDSFMNKLKYLARRKLDKTTLLFFRKLYDNRDDISSLKTAFDRTYETLKETDGFLTLPTDENDADKIGSEEQIKRATNIFWNIVSIGSICGHKVSSQNINAAALRAYDLSECKLSDSEPEKACLCETDLIGADLSGADLKRAKLRGADLSRANFKGTDLSWADLSEANLKGADLRWATLDGADFNGADLSEANLSDATLNWTDFNDANLSRAVLNRADLKGAHLFGAHFCGADLREACLNWADLSLADLSQADLSGAKFFRAQLYATKLVEIIINEMSSLDGALIDKSGADYLKSLGCDTSNTIITNYGGELSTE